MGVGKTRDWNYLEGKELFILWAQLGSLSKVRENLIQSGILNPETGKPPTQAGIRVAVRRWMAQNPAEARKLMLELGESWASNDQEWNQWLVHQARGSLGNLEFQRFLDRNDLHEYVQYQQ